MVFSAVSGGANGPVKLADAPKQEIQVKVIQNNNAVESSVRNYFSDIPVMVNVAWCESRFRQFDKEGDVFRGEENNQDVGVMQINEHYHLDTAIDGNYNLYSIDGNMAYARKLYEKFGTAPWNSSKPCWGRMNSEVATTNGKVLASANVN
jgi:hypothetical protein